MQEHRYDCRCAGDFVARNAGFWRRASRRCHQRPLEVQLYGLHGERGSNPKFPTRPRSDLPDYGILLFLGKGLRAEALRQED